MLHILTYLLESYMSDQIPITLPHDELKTQLQQFGFAASDIRQALAWLDGLKRFSARVISPLPESHASTRIFSAKETAFLNLESRRLLIFLECSGILTPYAREIVIDRLFALGGHIELADVKWVALMTLFHYPQKRQLFSPIQDFLFHTDIITH